MTNTTYRVKCACCGVRLVTTSNVPKTCRAKEELIDVRELSHEEAEEAFAAEDARD